MRLRNDRLLIWQGVLIDLGPDTLLRAITGGRPGIRDRAEKRCKSTLPLIRPEYSPTAAADARSTFLVHQAAVHKQCTGSTSASNDHV